MTNPISTLNTGSFQKFLAILGKSDLVWKFGIQSGKFCATDNHKVNNVVNPNIPQASIGTQSSPLAGISLSLHQNFRHSIFSNGQTAFRYFY